MKKPQIRSRSASLNDTSNTKIKWTFNLFMRLLQERQAVKRENMAYVRMHSLFGSRRLHVDELSAKVSAKIGLGK